MVLITRLKDWWTLPRILLVMTRIGTKTVVRSLFQSWSWTAKVSLSANGYHQPRHHSLYYCHTCNRLAWMWWSYLYRIWIFRWSNSKYWRDRTTCPISQLHFICWYKCSFNWTDHLPNAPSKLYLSRWNIWAPWYLCRSIEIRWYSLRRFYPIYQ